MIERTVYVYTHEEPGRRPLVLTYLDYQTGHACVHVVTVDGWRAADGRRAKAAAEREHRRRCLSMGTWVRRHPWEDRPYTSPEYVERLRSSWAARELRRRERAR